MASLHTLPSEQEETDTVTLSRAEYDILTRSFDELEALHIGGVKDWDWYWDCLKDAGLTNEETEEEDDDDD